MKPVSKIYVAGHRGMVSSDIVCALQSVRCRSVVPVAKVQFDESWGELMDSNRLNSFGWQVKAIQAHGLALAYQDFLERTEKGVVH